MKYRKGEIKMIYNIKIGQTSVDLSLELIKPFFDSAFSIFVFSYSISIF